MEPTEEEKAEFELTTRKNAHLIVNFCELMGMTPIEAGVAAEFFSECVKQACGAESVSNE